jgi:hypothetical protein
MMTKFYLTLTTLCLLVLPAFGQSSLIPEKWYDVASWLPDYPNVGAFDFSDTLFYLNDGDTIHMFGVNSGNELKKYGEPEDYTATHYVSFLTVSPDGETIWTGYTSSDNLDDRIYSIDAESGEWELEAIFPANMDLEFWNDSILVSGLNSSSWDAPAAIFVLDISGANEHRRIIEPGGYSAGIAVDKQGNLYYGTSYPMDPNGLYRWDSSSLQLVIEIPDSPALQVSHAEKLSDLPSGAYDCEVDEAGNVLFNMNLDGGTQVMGWWNGTMGDGEHIDTLATASGEWDWLGTLKAKGDISMAGLDNMVVTYSFGQPLTIVTRRFTVGIDKDYAPEIFAYPNPSTGIFTIRNGSSEVMDVKFYTLQGSLVYEKADFQSGSVIDISNQAAGSYIISVTSAKGFNSKMIQKL